MVIYVPIAATLIITVSFLSPITISFIPDLTHSFSANLSTAAFLFFLQDWLDDSPHFFTVTSSIGYVALCIAVFRLSKGQLSGRHLGIWNWHLLRYHVKFCGDRSNCCRDITFFRVFQVKCKISLCHAYWNNLAKVRDNWINFCIDINTIWACKILFRWGNIAKKIWWILFCRTV